MKMEKVLFILINLKMVGALIYHFIFNEEA